VPLTLARVAFAMMLSGLLAGLATGCGQDAVRPDELHGRDVARMAERELEAENPRMAVGTLTCPGLKFRRDASVRCLRTVELSEGRVVKVPGTVIVSSVAGGGRLHVAQGPAEPIVAQVRPMRRAGARRTLARFYGAQYYS